MVTEEEAKRIVDAISAERFQPFLDECGGDPLIALRLYYWDGEASRAFLSALRDFEVSMRNSFHSRLAGRYGRADWWDSPCSADHQGSPAGKRRQVGPPAGTGAECRPG